MSAGAGRTRPIVPVRLGLKLSSRLAPVRPMRPSRQLPMAARISASRAAETPPVPSSCTPRTPFASPTSGARRPAIRRMSQFRRFAAALAPKLDAGSGRLDDSQDEQDHGKETGPDHKAERSDPGSARFRPGPQGARRGPLAGPGPLPPFQAERMTGRGGVEPEPWLGAGQPGRPQREHLRLRGRDVVNVDVQVDLLGKRRVRPARWLVAG